MSPGIGPRRRDHHREIGRLRQVAQARIAALAEDLLVLGIDRAQRAAQSARGEVLPHQAPERALALGGADQRDAPGASSGASACRVMESV